MSSFCSSYRTIRMTHDKLLLHPDPKHGKADSNDASTLLQHQAMFYGSCHDMHEPCNMICLQYKFSSVLLMQISRSGQDLTLQQSQTSQFNCCLAA